MVAVRENPTLSFRGIPSNLVLDITDGEWDDRER